MVVLDPKGNVKSCTANPQSENYTIPFIIFNSSDASSRFGNFRLVARHLKIAKHEVKHPQDGGLTVPMFVVVSDATSFFLRSLLFFFGVP